MPCFDEPGYATRLAAWHVIRANIAIRSRLGTGWRYGQQMTPDEVRQAVAERLPDYIQMLDGLIRKPGRNAQTQMAGIKLALSLVVPAVTAATITGAQGGPVQVTLTIVEPGRDK